jgi:hypothetical protein
MVFGLIGLFLGPTLLAVGYSMFDEWSSDSEKPLLDGERASDLSTDGEVDRSRRVAPNTKAGTKE